MCQSSTPWHAGHCSVDNRYVCISSSLPFTSTAAPSPGSCRRCKNASLYYSRTTAVAAVQVVIMGRILAGGGEKSGRLSLFGLGNLRGWCGDGRYRRRPGSKDVCGLPGSRAQFVSRTGRRVRLLQFEDKFIRHSTRWTFISNREKLANELVTSLTSSRRASCCTTTRPASCPSSCRHFAYLHNLGAAQVT